MHLRPAKLQSNPQLLLVDPRSKPPENLCVRNAGKRLLACVLTNKACREGHRERK